MDNRNQGKPWQHTALKYAWLTIAGVILFGIGAAAAYAQRGYKTIGGEGFVLFLPFFYWIISDMVNDMLDTFIGDPEIEAGKEARTDGTHRNVVQMSVRRSLRFQDGSR